MKNQDNLRILSNSCENIHVELENINRIAKIAIQTEFQNICEFDINTWETPLTFENSMNLERMVKGIYLIEIRMDSNKLYRDWIDDFAKKFRGLDLAEIGKNKFLHQFTPNIIEKRKYAHKENRDGWIPFYLGKSKDIKERIKIHIFSTMGKPPFALKLKNRLDNSGKCILDNDRFRLRILDLSVVDNNVYDAVVPHFEKTIRAELSPIVGRQ